MLNLLQQHQFEFANALLNHKTARKQFVRKIAKTSKISPQLALDIYRNNTCGARLKTLEMIYPVCKKILGVETFQLISQQYVIEDTEGSSDLNDYGESFTLHLKSLLEAGRLPEEYFYLSDLVEFEYKMHAAYYANTDPMFPFELFEKKINSTQQVYFKTSSSLGLIVSEYPIYEIWNSNKEQYCEAGIKSIEGKQYLLVYRNNYKSSVAVISDDEYNIINAVTNNFSLQEIINMTDCNVNNILPGLIANKWIVDIK